MKRYVYGLTVFLWFLSASLPCGAADTNWVGASGDWFDGNQWDNGVPDLSGKAYIDNGGEALITAGTASARTLYLGSSDGGSGTVTQTGGEYGNITAYGSGIYLGYSSGSTGNYNMSGSGIVLGSEGVEYGDSGSGGDLGVGRGGTGLFSHSAGTVDIYGSVDLGVYASTEGAYALSGGALNVSRYWLWNYYSDCDPEGFCWEDEWWSQEGGELRVGKYGTGHFQQTGGTVDTYRLSLGDGNSLSSGTYELTGLGQLSAKYESIGTRGTGTFIHTGGQNTVATLKVGGPSGSSVPGYGSYQLSDTGQLSSSSTTVGEGKGVGEFIHTGGTHSTNLLILANYPNSEGRYELSSSGELTANTEYIGDNGTGLFEQTGGTNTVSNRLDIGYDSGSQGTYTISGGTLSTGELNVGSYYTSNDGRGTLNITSADAEITVSKHLNFGVNSALTAVPGSTIHMTGSNLYNKNTNPTDLAGLNNLELIFEGGSADTDTFEVAGIDMGAVLEGFDDNFALGTLTLGGVDIGQMQLVDLFDNSTGTEALYVFSLNIGDGSLLDLNGINIYFLTGIIDPGATILLNGGALIQATIPEPASILLIGTGLGGLVLMNRKRRKR